MSSAGVAGVSYTTALLDRSSTADVVVDEDGKLGMKVFTRINSSSGQENDLVTATNQFGRNVTVTVALENQTTRYDLVHPDTGAENDTVTFALGKGSTKTVEIRWGNCGGPCKDDTIRFSVRASAPGLSANAVRVTSME